MFFVELNKRGKSHLAYPLRQIKIKKL
jgi:hypothetical protein